jgi:phage terminase Nu1 subunit (DNA packaging protein)
MPFGSLSDAKVICTATQLGEVIGRTTRQVHQLTSDLKVLRKGKRGYRLDENVQAFLQYREAVVRKECSRTSNGYETARTSRMTALATIESMRARQIRGELLERSRVVFLMTNLLSVVRNHLLSIPSRVMHSLVGKTDPREINAIVRDEVHRALREASEFDEKMFTQSSRSSNRRSGTANGDADD